MSPRKWEALKAQSLISTSWRWKEWDDDSFFPYVVAFRLWLAGMMKTLRTFKTSKLNHNQNASLKNHKNFSWTEKHEKLISRRIQLEKTISCSLSGKLLFNLLTFSRDFLLIILYNPRLLLTIPENRCHKRAGRRLTGENQRIPPAKSHRSSQDDRR